MVTWVGYNGCSADPIVEVVDYGTDSVSDEATFYSYPCSDGTILEHYAVGGAGHSFGRGATLDGVRIDYGVAFDFIDRVEEGGTSGPPAPSPPAPIAPAEHAVPHSRVGRMRGRRGVDRKVQ